MKRLLIAAILGLSLFIMGVHVGVSYFTDVALSKGNSISTGDFDIGISRDGSRFYDEHRLFSFEDMKPGESKRVEFYVKNRGDYEISKIYLVFNVTDLEDDISKAEKEVDTSPEVGELGKYLRIGGIFVELGGKSSEVPGVAEKSLRDINGTTLEIFRGKLPPGEKLKVVMILTLPEDVGNDCLTDRVVMNLTIVASQ